MYCSPSVTPGCLGEWTDVDGWVGGGREWWMEGGSDGRMEGWMDGQTDGGREWWLGGWLGGWREGGGMDGCQSLLHHTCPVPLP